jgi:hypothetical protein
MNGRSHPPKLKRNKTNFFPLPVGGEKDPKRLAPEEEQMKSETAEKWNGPAIIRVIRANDPWEGMSEEEIEDASEFIRWYVNKDFAALLLIPAHPRENDFWFSSYGEFQESAFNTHDFQSLQRPFDKYAYRIKKIMERVKDLAILYSCLTLEEGREDTRRRYENLVASEFRDRLTSLVKRYQRALDFDEKMLLKPKIAELSRRTMRCKKVWEKYSTWD